MLADASGMHFVVYDSGQDALETKDYLHEVNENDDGRCWVAAQVGTGITLRNLAAKRYASIDAAGHIVLSNEPVVLTISFIDGVAIINGQRMMLVLSESGQQARAVSVVLSRTSANLMANAQIQLTATVLPENAVQTVAWRSSDESVATVSENGLVTAMAAGTATITASTIDGTKLTATCEVSVAIAGDVNRDGNVNGADIVAVINYLFADNIAGDVNGDGYVNGADIVAEINYVLIYSDNKWERASAARRAINTPVQGSGSDLLISAVTQINKELKGIAWIGATVHDSIIGECHVEDKDFVDETIRRIMLHPKVLDDFGVELRVPLDVDIGWGPWGTH